LQNGNKDTHLEKENRESLIRFEGIQQDYPKRTGKRCLQQRDTQQLLPRFGVKGAGKLAGGKREIKEKRWELCG